MGHTNIDEWVVYTKRQVQLGTDRLWDTEMPYWSQSESDRVGIASYSWRFAKYSDNEGIEPNADGTHPADPDWGSRFNTYTIDYCWLLQQYWEIKSKWEVGDKLQNYGYLRSGYDPAYVEGVPGGNGRFINGRGTDDVYWWEDYAATAYGLYMEGKMSLGFAIIYSDNEGNWHLYDGHNSFTGTATVDNVWLAGTLELGDTGDWWCLQQEMYSYTIWMDIGNDQAGYHYDQFVWYDRDAVEGQGWQVNLKPYSDGLYGALIGQQYSYGFA